MMLLHSIIIGIVLYVIMIYGLKQRPVVAENRSIILAALILIYMMKTEILIQIHSETSVVTSPMN